jgi:hypothetical protein
MTSELREPTHVPEMGVNHTTASFILSVKTIGKMQSAIHLTCIASMTRDVELIRMFIS